MVERDTTFHASGLVLRHGMGRRAFCGLHIAYGRYLAWHRIPHGTVSHTACLPLWVHRFFDPFFQQRRVHALPSATPEAKPRGSIVENLELLEKLKSLHDRDGTDGSRFWEAPLR